MSSGQQLAALVIIALFMIIPLANHWTSRSSRCCSNYDSNCWCTILETFHHGRCCSRSSCRRWFLSMLLLLSSVCHMDVSFAGSIGLAFNTVLFIVIGLCKEPNRSTQYKITAYAKDFSAQRKF